MTEAQIGLLIKAASTIVQNDNTNTSKILKSYYLMRCKSITKDFGLPKKQFSNEVRCSRCCIEWNYETKAKLNPIKLSKRQKKRIKSKRKINEPSSQKHLLHSNELIRVCSFCGESTKITHIKPNKVTKPIITEEKQITPTDNKIVPKKHMKVTLKPRNQELESSVYCKSKAAFSLKEKRNTLQSTINVAPSKVIKNNKKKKDKFAGLCKNAVVAVAQIKKEKESKLNLFLKPSL